MSEQMSEGAIERVAHAIMKAFADNGKTAALLSLMPQDARAAARAAIAALSHSPRPAGTVEVMADADKVITIYDAVHGELEQNGDDWSKIDLVKHGFNEAARRMSYANWRGYMTGAIYHALKAVALIHRQRALTPQTTGEKDKL